MNKRYWVPENFLFDNDGICLDLFPDDGAAVQVTPVLPDTVTITREELRIAWFAMLNKTLGKNPSLTEYPNFDALAEQVFASTAESREKP